MYKINDIAPDKHNFLQIIHTIDKKLKSLYFIGTLPESPQPAVAMVGTRKPTAYGREVGYRIAYELARQGIIIISGLALGMDAVFHRAALDAKGVTIAVLPGHPSNIVPRTNQQLATDIIHNGGAVLSEYSIEAGIQKHYFLARNRLVSALSQGVLIVEAARQSGTLATAAFGLEQGKSIMAVPGPVTSPMSEGCNRLIAQGARLITSSQDVLDELGLVLKKQQTTLPLAATAEEYTLLQLVAKGIRDGELLQQQSGLSPSVFAQTLTLLEIQGKLKSLGANQWGI